jgi:hypothetical protein
MPTTVGVVGRGSCTQLPVERLTFDFHSDGTFLESSGPQGAGFTFTGSFVETRPGEVAILNGSDTAVVSNGVLRVRLTGMNCSGEVFVAK